MEDKNILLGDVLPVLAKSYDLENAYLILYENKRDTRIDGFVEVLLGICTMDSPIIPLYSKTKVNKWSALPKICNPCPGLLKCKTNSVTCITIVVEKLMLPTC